MVRILLSYWDSPYFQGQAVSFREGIQQLESRFGARPKLDSLMDINGAPFFNRRLWRFHFALPGMYKNRQAVLNKNM